MNYISVSGTILVLFSTKQFKIPFIKANQHNYSQRLSVISRIHKKGDKDSLKNYIPISLTNTDYKIIAFVLAKRLQNILSKLINKNQSAYIKGRYIWENARLMLDVFEYCETENIDGLLLFFRL